MQASPGCHEAQPDGEPGRPPLARRWAFRLMVMLLLGACGLLDYATGTEVSVFLVYMLPVALATRWLGATEGVWAALAAGAIWVLADVATGHVYSRDWILWVNAANRLLTFFMAVAVVRHVSKERDQAVHRWQHLTQGLSVCQQCDKVRATDGQWRTPMQHLQEWGGAVHQAKVCPDCARRSYARAAYMK
jgi:hypothetical protein